jgi:hypothetical protein
VSERSVEQLRTGLRDIGRTGALLSKSTLPQDNREAHRGKRLIGISIRTAKALRDCLT